MHLQITAAPDPALIAAATRHGLRRPVWLARAAGWLTLAVALVAQLSIPLLALGVVLAVVAPILLLRMAWPGVTQVTTFEITPAGVASSSAASRHSYAWPAFRSVEQLPGQLLFRLGGTRFLPVPTKGLSAAEIDQVLGFASVSGLPVRRFPQLVGQVRKFW